MSAAHFGTAPACVPDAFDDVLAALDRLEERNRADDEAGLDAELAAALPLIGRLPEPDLCTLGGYICGRLDALVQYGPEHARSAVSAIADRFNELASDGDAQALNTAIAETIKSLFRVPAEAAQA